MEKFFIITLLALALNSKVLEKAETSSIKAKSVSQKVLWANK